MKVGKGLNMVNSIEVDIEPGTDLNNLILETDEDQDSVSKVRNSARDQLESSEIDLGVELSPPQVSIEIQQNNSNYILSTQGNFSLIIGKAKSRKTFFITILLAAALRNNNVLTLFKGSLPVDQKVVLSFDTEQGGYHVQKAARRVLNLAGINTTTNFKAYSLRRFTPAERLAIIEYALYNTPNLGFVVIDGIRDLITSINDEEQATMLVGKLLKWTEELNIHIACVLHQNKGDSNARGHVGSEAQNKAEISLSISKDPQNKDCSIVEAEYCREKEFAPFAFSIDSQGLPTIIDDWDKKNDKPSTKSSLMPHDVLPAMHQEILGKIFAKTPQLKYSHLVSQIKILLGEYGVKLGDNKVKDFVQWYIREQMIFKNGKEGSPNSYYTLTKPPV